MKIALLTATRLEMDAVVGAFEQLSARKSSAFDSDGHHIITCVMGIGATRIRSITRSILGDHKPDALLLAGYSGGIAPGACVGDIVTPGRVLHESGTALDLATDSESVLLTVDQLADTVERKQELFQRYAATAVDMEAYHVAQAASAAGTALQVIRAISDAHDQALPAEAMNWLAPDGSIRQAAVAAYVLTHPWQAPMLARIGRDSRAAGEALGKAVRAWVLHCGGESQAL